MTVEQYARSLATNAVSLEGKCCEACGATAAEKRLERHHDDYLKPFDVRILCRSCHRKHHDKMKRLSAGNVRPTLKTTSNVPKDLMKRIKILAANTGKGIGETLAEVIRSGLAAMEEREK